MRSLSGTVEHETHVTFARPSIHEAPLRPSLSLLPFKTELDEEIRFSSLVKGSEQELFFR